MKKVGLSLSFCIADICKGIVAEEDVLIILTSTCARNDHDWWNIFESYSKSYWIDFPEKALDVLLRLFSKGIIHQPRMYSTNYLKDISQGHWEDV